MQASQKKSAYLLNLEKNRAGYVQSIKKRRAMLVQVHSQGTDVPVNPPNTTGKVFTQETLDKGIKLLRYV